LRKEFIPGQTAILITVNLGNFSGGQTFNKTHFTWLENSFFELFVNPAHKTWIYKDMKQ
jgi:hypothetical protein